MKHVYDVTIDYVTTCKVSILAENGDVAEKAVNDLISSRAEGFIDMVLERCMHANVPDGLEIAYVSEHVPDCDLEV